MNDQKVFGVRFLGVGREVKASGNQSPTVDEDYFVVRYLMLGVNECRNAGIEQKICGGILFRFLAFIENRQYLDAALVRCEACCRDRF